MFTTRTAETLIVRGYDDPLVTRLSPGVYAADKLGRLKSRYSIFQNASAGAYKRGEKGGFFAPTSGFENGCGAACAEGSLPAPFSDELSGIGVFTRWENATAIHMWDASVAGGHAVGGSQGYQVQPNLLGVDPWTGEEHEYITSFDVVARRRASVTVQFSGDVIRHGVDMRIPRERAAPVHRRAGERRRGAAGRSSRAR